MPDVNLKRFAQRLIVKAVTITTGMAPDNVTVTPEELSMTAIQQRRRASAPAVSFASVLRSSHRLLLAYLNSAESSHVVT